MKTTTKKPTRGAAAELAALREDIRLMREANLRHGDHLGRQIKELREGLQAAWEVLALAYRADELEKRRKGASKPDEVLRDEETALFFTSLGCMLKHQERIEAVLESLRNRPKSGNG